MKLRALAMVVIAVVLSVFTSSQTLATTTVPTTAEALPAVDPSATPAGWVPVAFGDAQVSVPPTWVVMTHAWCGAWKSPVVQLGVIKQDMMCPVAGSPLTVRITPLGPIPAPYDHEQPVLLNGISVLLGPKVGESISYLVPSLHVELWATEGAGARVTDTLAVSPRSVALASGPAPVVPSSWRQVSFAGLHFSAPPNWPITRTQVTPGLGAICKTRGVAFTGTTVTLSTDVRPMLLPPCPYFPPTPQQPENGVQVDSGLRTEPMVTLSFSDHCLVLHGLTACPATSPAYSILVLRVNVPGRDKPVFVSIGLAGNGMVAQTILSSLRPASASTFTPASFLVRAKAGIDGTFSAVYKLSAPSSSTANDATVTVAQRAAAGSTSWPGGKPGEWSYRLSYADGSTVEWLVRGDLLVNCWRVRTSKWRCSAGHYNGDAGSIGYTIATIPYLPGTAFMSLSIALQAMPPHASLAVRSEQSSVGPLTCVRDGDGTWCLMRDGHLATWTGLGFTGYSWTNAQLVSEQPTAPATDFVLSGVPRGPWLLPVPE